MRLVIIESPFAAPTPEGLARNVAYAEACMRDCLDRGEAPYASHLLYPRVLDDTKPEERAKGMAAGFAWRAVCTKTVVYMDLGNSRGMIAGMENALAAGHEVECRRLPGWT